jgi:hypothetical protein
MPPWADTLLNRFLQTAAKRAGITSGSASIHSAVQANGEDVKVVQELEQAIANTTAIRVLKAIGMPYQYGSRTLTWCSS